MMAELVALLILLQESPGLPRPEEIEQIRTKTAYVLDQGEVEADVVGSFLRFDERGRKFDESRIMVEVEVGVLHWLMAEVEVPYVFLNPDPGRGERGWGDVELELKAGIPGSWMGIELAVGLEVSILTGDEDKGLGSPNPELGAFVAASRRFGWITAHLQLGVEAARDVRAEYEVNAALDAMPWGRQFSLLLALNGEIERGEAAGWSLVPGFELRLEEAEFQIGLGFPIGLTEEAAAWGLLLDIEIEF